MEKQKWLCGLNIQLFADEGNAQQGADSQQEGQQSNTQSGQQNDPQKTTYTEADLDRARRQASDTARQNAEKELREKIRKELEEEAKLSAEEKAKKDLEKQIASIKEERIELNKDRASNILKEAGMDLSNSKTILESIVSDDKDTTIARATALANEFKASIEKLRKNDQEQNVKGVEPPKQSQEKAKSWKDMTYEERVELKTKNPTLYAEYVKKYAKKY